MKRVKDDEKAMGPMFPRLHVNDTEKGGPRAPPRNKMALYEQLSFPSQKINPSLTNTNKTINITLQASSNQETGFKRNLSSLVQFPSCTPSHQPEKSFSSQSNETKLPAPSKQLVKRKKVEEDDFRVPLHANYREDLANENQGHSMLEKPSADQLLKSTSSRITTGNLNDCSSGDASLGHEHSISDDNGLHDCDIIKRKAGLQCNGAEHDDALVDSTMTVQNGCIHVTISCFDSVDNATDITNGNGIEKHGTRMRNSFHGSNLAKSNSVPKGSLVNAVSSMDISPDDVVGIIGQNHFLKARRVIANQQKVFAVQVFELHRLIKMQQLIAGSPELLVEDAILLEKSSLKMSSAKKVPLGYVVKPQPQILKCNDIPENLSHKMESSVENGVGKPSLSSVRRGDSPYYYPPSENAQLGNTSADCNIGPWWSSQFPGHQWLLPVMSPSEGLVYKPYPGAEYSGLFYGGSGPYDPASFTGVVSGNQPVVYSYSPYYGTSVVPSTVSVTGIEQMSHAGGPDSLSRSDQFSAGGSDSVKHQIPSDVLNQIAGAARDGTKFQSPKESELLGSTASSPGDIVQGAGPRKITEGFDAFPLVLASTLVPQGGPHSRTTEQRMRVIKVVPHNRGSATESAARIFQSIREERKYLNSI